FIGAIAGRHNSLTENIHWMPFVVKDLKEHEFPKLDEELTCIPERQASATARRSDDLPGVSRVTPLAEAPGIDAGPYGEQSFQFRQARPTGSAAAKSFYHHHGPPQIFNQAIDIGRDGVGLIG